MQLHCAVSAVKPQSVSNSVCWLYSGKEWWNFY